MSDTKIGYDRYTISTPVQLRRGSAVVLRRRCEILDEDTQLETGLDISGATEIRWELLQDLKSTSSAILARSKTGAAIAFYSGGTNGWYALTLSASDTKGITPGVYLAEVAVTLPGGFYKFKPYHVMLLAAPALGE